MPVATSRPNILWITLEDASPRLGCYDDPLARTPNLDRLAAEGARYTNAFSTAPACAPSRAAVITGMYQTSIGAHHMRTSHTDPAYPELPTPYEAVPPPYVKAFPEFLRLAGYFCTNNGKTDYQFEPPASAWDECGDDATWEHRPDPSQPFFAVFNLIGTHESYMWLNDDEPLVTDPDGVVMPPYLPDTPKAREALAHHYDNIAASDAIVGDLLTRLDGQGLTDNTVVVVWSDHGEGLPRAKHTLYDGGLRVPLIVRWPGAVEPGTVSEELVSMIDLGPTVLTIAGVDVPAYVRGRSFLQASTPPREYVYATRDRAGKHYDMRRAVRDKTYKYIQNYYADKPLLYIGGFSDPHGAQQELWRLHLTGELTDAQASLFRTRQPAEELYDCEADPHELTNLAGDANHVATLNRLRHALDAWQADTGDPSLRHSEADLVATIRPAGAQPQAVPPQIVLVTDEGAANFGPTRIVCPFPAMIVLNCATQGASIVYTLDHADDPPRPGWRIYTEPIRLPLGRAALTVKAVRIGYRDSDPTHLAVTTERPRA